MRERYDWPCVAAWASSLAFSVLVWAGLVVVLAVVAELVF